MTEIKHKKISEHHHKIVDALSKSVEIFTSHSEKTFSDVMSNGLRPVAEAVGLDRIVVFQLRPGKTSLGQTYVWAYGKTADLDDELVELPGNPPVIRWLNTLTKGECINGNVNEMARDEAEFLSRFGVKSVFLVPIFTHNNFWGIVSLEDHTMYRYFDDDCLELLRSAARLCANAFIRNEITREVAAVNDFSRAIFDAAPIGFALVNSDLQVFDCNDTIVDLLGSTKQYYMDNFFEFSPEYQADGSKSTQKSIEILKRALNGEKQKFEWIHRSLTGELIPFEITLSRTLYKGKYIIQAFQYDLRNIKKMEKVIAEAEELTRTVTEASPIPYILFDENLRALDCNEEMMRILACSDKQYLLDHYWDTFVPEQQSNGQDSFNEAMSKRNESLSGMHNAFEWIHQSLNGELVPMENTLTQTMYKGKKLFISFKYDLRSTKEMMENIRNQSEQLKDALHKATAASRAKSAFLSNMSHEIRTPLNAIIGMTTIGKNVTDIDRKDYALKKIEDASAHLLGVINDILDMSKIEASKFELSPAEFNFEKMIQRVVDVVNFRVGEKQQRLAVYLDKSIPKNLIGDGQRIAQVITNLLGNAVKFTPEKGSISLDTRFVGEENIKGTEDSLCTIQISVKDTGIGISDEQKERLFQSFQQAENSTVRKFGGTGLGLAISRNIVELMGGRIWVESEIDKGSTFFFTIKIKQGTENSTCLFASRANLKNTRILAVDDDPDVLEYIREILQGLGTSCDTAKDGDEALALIEKKGPYNIYFIDWKMPGIDGITLTSRLKSKTSDADNAVVIMISAFDWNIMENEAKKAGVDKFLSKPLFPSAIADILRECLGLGEQAEETPSDINGLFDGYSILLAEDMEINREIVLSLLEPTRLKIDCADNGAKAVRMYTEAPEKYDLIIMDVQMPEMDGYEATRLIREFEAKNLRHPKKIVAMTANVFQEDIQKCLEAGMNSHLGKPLNFNELVDKLRSSLPVQNTARIPA